MRERIPRLRKQVMLSTTANSLGGKRTVKTSTLALPPLTAQSGSARYTTATIKYSQSSTVPNMGLLKA